MFKRIMQMFVAQGAAQGITIITQFLLPPAFVYYYGVRGYGEWLVLSAAVSYMSSLNIGIGTYASNELTILRRRGDMERYRELQASAQIVLFTVILLGVLILSLVFLLPAARLLKLTISNSTASWTLFFLGLQILAQIFAGFYNGLFMVIEKTHRNISYGNWRRLAMVLLSLPFIVIRSSFAVIALVQLIAGAVVIAISIISFRKAAPELPFELKSWNWQTIKSTLRPSGMFGMIAAQGFLLFQVPLLIFQWLLGPEMVVIFSVSRTIFGTARQILSAITFAISPEITFSYGSGNFDKLLEIFHYSEKLVFSLIVTANFSAYLFSPVLLRLWMHKPQLFDPALYGLMALISSAMSMKEHKLNFQFATNEHEVLSQIVFWLNVAINLMGIPATMRFGVEGFMVVWLLAELAQMFLIYRENRKLFNYHDSLSLKPVFKLIANMAASLVFCFALLRYCTRYGLTAEVAAGVVGSLVMMLVAYVLYDVRAVAARFQKRTRATAA